MRNSTKTRAFQAVSGIFEDFLPFIFKNCRQFLKFKSSIPRTKEVEQNPEPGQWEPANPLGSRGGWNG